VGQICCEKVGVGRSSLEPENARLSFMMRWTAPAFAIAVVAVVAVACARFTSGDSSGGPNADGDGGTSSGGSTSGGTSGSSGGGADGGGEEEGDARAGDCDARFCSNFDPPARGPLWRWDRSTDEVMDGSVPKIALGPGRSPPYSMTVIAIPSKPQPQPSQFVEKDISAQTFTVDFTLRMDESPTEQTDAIDFIQVLCGTAELQRTKLSRNGAINLAAPSTSQVPVGPNIAKSLWIPLHFSFNPGTVRLERSDESVTGMLAIGTCPTAKIVVRLGGMLDTDDKVAGTWKLSFDDVRISY
jgi:hypothetical protein